jgi:Leucine-rich repeat (LRR) protein
LELIDNQLSGSALGSLSNLSELQSLSLGGNQIKTFDDLKPLKNLEKLFQLDLIDCEICEVPEYREKIFEFFPSLEVIPISSF